MAGKRTPRRLIFPVNKFRYAPGNGPRRVTGAKGRYRPAGLASIKWTVELSPHCPFLELSWTDIANIAVSSLAIIKTLNVVEHVRTCLISGTVFSTPDSLPFETCKEALNHRIVIATAGAT